MSGFSKRTKRPTAQMEFDFGPHVACEHRHCRRLIPFRTSYRDAQGRRYCTKKCSDNEHLERIREAGL